MATQFRDTHFGHLVRFLSGNKLFQYPDEIQTPDIAFLDQPSTEDGKLSEAVKDTILVGWNGPDDPEVCQSRIISIATQPHPLQNPQNWSSGWKLLVTFQMCILNFSVYIASSIYVPGTTFIMEDFGVGEIVATLGLSLFTL
jgi:DHA1 family multidrug resistance protein-like MFS transporter